MHTAFGVSRIQNGHIGRISASVVGIPFVTAVALVEDSTSFICASQLLCVVSHFLSSAFLAWMIDDAARLNVLFGYGLDLGSLCAQR